MRMGGEPTGPTAPRSRRRRRPASPPASTVSRRAGLVAEPLADELDLGLRRVGVVTLGLEQRPPVGLGLGLGPGVGRGQPGLDPFGHQLLGLGHQGLDHLVLGDDPDDLALDEQVAPLAAGGDAEVGLAGLARTVDHAAHDGHLDGQVRGPRGPPGPPGPRR